MSGGAFEYKQYQLKELIEEVKEQYKYFKEWSDEDIKNLDVEIKEAILLLKMAYIYLERLDYLFSGDDGVETFFERLESDLEDIL